VPQCGITVKDKATMWPCYFFNKSSIGGNMKPQTSHLY